MPEDRWPSGEIMAELEALRKRLCELEDLRKESKRLSESLEDFENRYRVLFDHASSVCLVIGSDGRLRDANAAATLSLGYTIDEVRGRNVFDFVVEEQRKEAAAQLHRTLTQDEDCEIEVGVRAKDGETHQFLFTPGHVILREKGKPDAILIVGKDITDRRQAEQALRDSDQRFRALLESIGEGVCAFDTEHCFVFANWAAAEIFETRPKHLAGRSLREYVSDEGWSAVLERTTGLRGGGNSPYELEIIRPDGKTRNIVVHASLTYDEAGKPSGIVTVMRDVTGHKSMEEALRESETKYRSLFEESIDVVYITSRDGRLVDISPSAESLFGYPREELIQRDVHGLYADPEERKAFQETIEKQGFVRGFEVTLMNSEGRHVDCLLTSVLRKSADGETLGYQGIIRDITERKRVDAARERERRTFRIIAEAAATSAGIEELGARLLSGLIEVLGFDGGTLRLHDRQKGLLEPVAVVGLSSDENGLVRTQSIETDVDCTAAHVARTGEPIFAPDAVEHKIWESHGERLGNLGIRALVSYPVFGAQRNLIAIVQLFARSRCEMDEEEEASFFETVAGMLGAVLERKIAEEEKHEVEAQLLQAQKMEAVGTLASGVAHDFNNLLTAIQGFADLALMSVDESERIHEDIKKIKTASDRGAALVKQLLLFGRDHPIELVPVNINRTAEGIVNMLAPLLGEDIVVNTVLEPKVWPVEADEGSLQQVLMNLAVNARDAMPDGGSLTIRTRNVTLDGANSWDGPEVRSGNSVCVSVEDSGSGMDQDTMGRIFEPFFSTKGPGKGTGLGLSVVYGIVKQHNGWIYTLSTPRMGTTFEIYLPATSDEPLVASDSGESIGTHAGAGERILVVEDEAAVRELAATVLRKHGYVVFEAADVKEAFGVFEEENGRFDLVFSDVVLPDKSGVQLVDELLRSRPELNVLMSSGHAHDRSQWDTIKEKGLPFIHKPYSLPDLLRTVRRIISNPESGGQPTALEPPPA